ncbi:MAG: class I SAM-dependent methyltransferase [Candidatus Bathyarchaeales archaeon]
MRHYDRTAEIYNERYAKEQNTKITNALERLHQADTTLVLDAGCGTGLLFSPIADKAKQIIGIDTSKNLLKQAKTKAKTRTNIHLVQADADHTPFLNKTFTVTFALTLLQNMPNPKTTLNEIKRITQPNGTIIITGLKKKFSLKKFTALVEKAHLKTLIIHTDEKLKDYVAICLRH